MHFTTAVAASAVLALATASSLAGQATFYGGNVAGGACSFSTYTLPSGIFGTALSDSNWDTAANCGACVSVTGPSGNSITAMIVDECPGCGTNHLDLFPDAFAALANPTTGVIDVTWEYVDCPITSPLEVHNKEGVSAYWFSMQVVNANQAVSSLEVSTDGGSTWQSTTRQTYNFFEQSSGFGTTTVDIKVTSDSGDVVIVNNVDVSSGASTTASGNFGSSGSSSVATSSTVAAVVASSSSTPVAAFMESTSVFETTTSSSAQVTGSAGGVFQEVSSSSSDATTKHTTLSSTTTLYKTITVPKSTSTSTTSSPTITASFNSSLVAYSTPVANSSTALPSGYSISVLTISMCKPTVLYSVFPVPSSSSTSSPSPAATGVASYSANITLSAPTSTPTAFTGSASSMQVSLVLVGFAGLITFLI
ncbi:uncharacterized protein LY89DRAFT_649993 [Mollisia scopiformis]|uniref:Expansin-like EG45 domain-containing protein n=1 Tax=Mollisia scopiformis TaxID=149040 RepID=A0A194X2M4_MOLSC|nr:uncharacterized protein LY89DRAFT_649993 [Mollisia scopiformis]KUJ14269.1 hypothetical protein LY89DRAFT_649993 [Mollisia scopiformis]